MVDRERIRKVLPGFSEFVELTKIAEAADEPVFGVSQALEEYEQLRVVEQRDGKYRGNEWYWQFRRADKLARENTKKELEEQLLDIGKRHNEFQDRFDCDSPTNIQPDEREDRERYEAWVEWNSLVDRADDVRLAYWFLTGEFPVLREK